MQGRLQRILAAAGVASRRGAEALVRAGRVRVNGRVASLGDSADTARDRIELDGEPVRPERPVYWLLHKPRGVVTTVRDPEGRPTVLGLLPARARDARVFPVGRLDRDSEGLLLLTNDGDLAHALLHPSLGNRREYQVIARGDVGPEKLARLERGVRLPEGRTAPARVRAPRFDPGDDTTRFTLVLGEGRKRQIRRSLRALGHPVRKLVRVRFGPQALGALAAGEARPLSRDEVAALRAHADRLRSRAQQPAGDRQRAEASRRHRRG